MRKNMTEIVFILDRSGSMSGLETDTIGGFNSMIEKQKKENGEEMCIRDRGASIFGWAGVDGIHFCFVRDFGGMVFSVSPMNSCLLYTSCLANQSSASHADSRSNKRNAQRFP